MLHYTLASVRATEVDGHVAEQPRAMEGSIFSSHCPDTRPMDSALVLLAVVLVSNSGSAGSFSVVALRITPRRSRHELNPKRKKK